MSRNSNHASSRILKQNLKIKCVACNELLPLHYFPKADMNILRKSQNALCTCCRTLCSNCGYPLIASTGERMQVRQKDLTIQMATLAENKNRASSFNKRMDKTSSNQNGGSAISMMSSTERANLWTMNDGETNENSDHNRLGRSGNSSNNDENNNNNNDELSFGRKRKLCEKCAENEMLASVNVYYRFPMLKHRHCPFPVQKYRELIAEELKAHREKNSGRGASQTPYHDDGMDAKKISEQPEPKSTKK